MNIYIYLPPSLRNLLHSFTCTSNPPTCSTHFLNLKFADEFLTLFNYAILPEIEHEYKIVLRLLLYILHYSFRLLGWTRAGAHCAIISRRGCFLQYGLASVQIVEFGFGFVS